MAKEITIEEVAVSQLLKIYSDLNKTKARVERALHNARVVRCDIVFEQDRSDDPRAVERMAASSMTIDRVIYDLEHAKTTLNG